MNLFAAAIYIARRDPDNNIAMTLAQAGWVFAENQERAVAVSKDTAKRMYPPNEGYSDHQVTIHLIPDEKIIEAFILLPDDKITDVVNKILEETQE